MLSADDVCGIARSGILLRLSERQIAEKVLEWPNLSGKRHETLDRLLRASVSESPEEAASLAMDPLAEDLRLFGALARGRL